MVEGLGPGGAVALAAGGPGALAAGNVGALASGGAGALAAGSAGALAAGGTEALKPGESRWRGMQGEWWMRADPSRPVVRGVDFALDTQEGGADEVYIIPDSDDEVYRNQWNFERDDDEFVPDSQPPEVDALEGINKGAISVEEEHRQKPNPRRLLGSKDLQRALFPDDNKENTKNDCGDEAVKGPVPQSKTVSNEEISIEDAETDDEGVGVGVELPLVQDETITELVTLFVPAYKQTKKTTIEYYLSAD